MYDLNGVYHEKADVISIKKCSSFWVLKVLNQSYWLSKFYPNLPKILHGYIRHIPATLKRHLANVWSLFSETLLLWGIVDNIIDIDIVDIDIIDIFNIDIVATRAKLLLKQMAELRGTSAAVSFKLVLGFAFFTTFDWICIFHNFWLDLHFSQLLIGL